MKMTKKMEPTAQDSSLHAGHDHSMAPRDPNVTEKAKASTSNAKTVTPTKEGADGGKHSGHSAAQKPRP